MNRVRIIILFIITPLITWYAHQKFTNPMQYHLMVELKQINESKTVHIFHENSFKRVNHLYILIDPTDSLATSLTEYQTIAPLNNRSFLFTQYSSNEIFIDTLNEINLETVHVRMIPNSFILSNQSGYFETIVLEHSPEEMLPEYIHNADIFISQELDIDKLLNKREILEPRVTVLTDLQLNTAVLNKYTNIFCWEGDKIQFKESRYNQIKIEKRVD